MLGFVKVFQGVKKKKKEKTCHGKKNIVLCDKLENLPDSPKESKNDDDAKDFLKWLESVLQTEAKNAEKDESKEQIKLFYEMRCPLVLLTGSMIYEDYLEEAKYDLELLQKLFQSKLGYHVFTTYDPSNMETECVTMSELEISNNGNSYDGLIFVWCGYGKCDEHDDAFLTSDDERKELAEVYHSIVIKTDYFVGKPKLLIKITWRPKRENERYKINKESVRENYNKKYNLFTISADILEKTTNDKSASHFTRLLCEEIEHNENKSLGSVIKNVMEQTSAKETARTITHFQSDIYLIPRHVMCNTDYIKYEQSTIFKKNIPEILYIKDEYNLMEEYRIYANVQAAEFIKLFPYNHWPVYLIPSKLIILHDINIDGNVYAINCELQCKENVNITAQLFVTKNTIVDQQVKLNISPIQWDTNIHHMLPFQFINIKQGITTQFSIHSFDKYIPLYQKYLQFVVDILGFDHTFVALEYLFIARIYLYHGLIITALTYAKRALQIRIKLFGTMNDDVAACYWVLGRIYNQLNSDVPSCDENHYNENYCKETAWKIKSTSMFNQKIAKTFLESKIFLLVEFDIFDDFFLKKTNYITHKKGDNKTGCLNVQKEYFPLRVHTKANFRALTISTKEKNVKQKHSIRLAADNLSTLDTLKFKTKRWKKGKKQCGDLDWVGLDVLFCGLFTLFVCFDCGMTLPKKQKGAQMALLGGTSAYLGWNALSTYMWNQQRYERFCDSLTFIRENIRCVEKCSPTNEGKLVHLTGNIVPLDSVRDEVFEFEMPQYSTKGMKKKISKAIATPKRIAIEDPEHGVIYLYREVQMYQLKETLKSHISQRIGVKANRQETSIDASNYQYEPIWSARYINSAHFHQPEAHQNPTDMPLSTVYHTNRFQICGFTFHLGYIFFFFFFLSSLLFVTQKKKRGGERGDDPTNTSFFIRFFFF
ncbi:hypothetical protein RFI_04057 [Reticulomyxa filosa]|uniref:Uncharacterized protein n=1 Tax=Reticulomyxa filosa TaxID=46433 RepID=X6P3D2_RETFI|nr:hypothetical protein RFI_04057 [Reticulomyxa filosa]|eukprot:ETO33050.1 hypothetical protein RFI_04057 [Reticulomyxa filosa]